MEKLNLPVNIESFQTCNKNSLVEGKYLELFKLGTYLNNVSISDYENYIATSWFSLI